jgi:hypothetical protein
VKPFLFPLSAFFSANPSTIAGVALDELGAGSSAVAGTLLEARTGRGENVGTILIGTQIPWGGTGVAAVDLLVGSGLRLNLFVKPGSRERGGMVAFESESSGTEAVLRSFFCRFFIA